MATNSTQEAACTSPLDQAIADQPVDLQLTSSCEQFSGTLRKVIEPTRIVSSGRRTKDDP